MSIDGAGTMKYRPRMRFISSRLAYGNKWLKVYAKRYRLTNGKEDDFYVIGKKERIVAIFAMDHGTVLLVRQYRWAVDAETLDIPGGGIRSDEDPLAAARRELLEETGYEASEWELLGCRYLDSGQKDCIQHIYLAQGLRKTSEPLQTETERTTVTKKHIKVLLDELRDAKHEPTESTIATALALHLARDTSESTIKG